MTSAINTSGINVNYPVPGINNSSQGFRDNFAAIKTDFNVAATEITDLQNNVVVKQALSGTTLNNNMANTLISNAATRGFRHSTFNLGNAISGTLVINASLGDVQTGTINGNTTIQFTGWAPSGTQSNVEVQLNIGNNLAVLALPEQVTINGTSGIETVENYTNANGIPTLTIPFGVNRLDYRFSSLDCGESITIEPYNQPRQSTQLQQRIPSPIGQQGDVAGTVCVDTATSLAFATCTATEDVYEIITCDSTAGFYLDMPIQFTGIVFGGVTAGTTYYVRSIPSVTTFTISATPGTTTGPAALVNLSTTSGSMTVSPVNYLYVSSGSFDATVIPKTASNTTIVTTTVTGTNTSATGNLITVSSTANFVVGYPVVFSGTISNVYATTTYGTDNVINVSSTAGMLTGGRIAFTGNVFGGLSQSTYYITNIYSGNSNITVSTTFGGSNLALTAGTTTGNCVASYNGIMGGLTTTDYFVQSVANGTTFTVSTSQGGAPVVLIDENGSMNVTTVTDYTVTLNSTSNIANNDPIVFSGNVFGGVTSGQTYYIANIVGGTTLSISKTRANGIAGQKMNLVTANGNMVVSVYEGTSIWKRTQLNNW
jgi:CTP-dependent riboflavin kinase